MRWPIGRASDSGAKGRGFDPHSGRRVVSLRKIHLPPKSTSKDQDFITVCECKYFAIVSMTSNLWQRNIARLNEAKWKIIEKLLSHKLQFVSSNIHLHCF